MSFYPLIRFITAFVALQLGAAAAATEGVSQAVVTTETTRLTVTPGLISADLVCRQRARQPRPTSPSETDPLEMPSDDDIEIALRARAETGRHHILLEALPRRQAGARIAFWGDSHLAAGFFTEELLRQWNVDPSSARISMLPGNIGRGGVRLGLRTACVHGEWRYEAAYTPTGAGVAKGPGLVSMSTAEPDAEIALDLRSPRAEGAEQIRLLYEPLQGPLRLAVSVNSGLETEVTVGGHSGSAVLEVSAGVPIQQIRWRLVSGSFRVHGVGLGPRESGPIRFDVFGHPGATAAGWGNASSLSVRSWFSEDPYDLVVLAFGTNEGNAAAFDREHYRQMLAASVSGLRAAFPLAQCLLIGPGDRGVLVRRSQKSKVIRTARMQDRNANAASARRPLQSPSRVATPLLKYSLIHGDINQIQEEIARASGCYFWSAMEAMGGAGSAYTWRKSGLMARDLIHFSVKGYQELAQLFARAHDWSAAFRPHTHAPQGPEAR